MKSQILYHGAIYRSAVGFGPEESKPAKQIWDQLINSFDDDSKDASIESLYVSITDAANAVVVDNEGSFEDGYRLGVASKGRPVVYLNFGDVKAYFIKESDLIRTLNKLKSEFAKKTK